MPREIIVIIGAGPSGIACALELAKTKKYSVVLIDAGNHYSNRTCAVDDYLYCTDCSECNVISGFGGSIHYGDSVKLSRYPSGKSLFELIGAARYECYFSTACEFVGVSETDFTMSQCSSNATLDIKHYGIHILTSEEVKRFITVAFSRIQEDPFISLFLNSRVTAIKKNDNGFTIFYTTGFHQKTVNAHRIIVATGRAGFSWWREELKKLDIDRQNPISSLGFRFELPKEFLIPFGKDHPDLKIRTVKDGYKYKTFCFCAGSQGGRIKYTNYKKYTLLDGHVLVDGDSECSVGNFALLSQLKDKKGCALSFEDIYEKYIKPYIDLNKKNPGKPVFQSYCDFKRKEWTEDYVLPSVKDVLSAPLWSLISPSFHKNYCEVADAILQFIFTNSSAPEADFHHFIKSVNIIALELEGLWDCVTVNNGMMTSIDGLYVSGDCSGLSQGIIQSMISGIAAAQDIINK